VPYAFDPMSMLENEQDQTKPDNSIKIDGDRIRLARDSRQLSQTELAELVGVSTPTVHRWETNNAYVGSKMQDLCCALDYPETFFVPEKIITPIVNPPQYRTTTSISVKNQRTAEARAYIRYDQILRAFKKWVDYNWGFSRYDPDEYDPKIIARMVRQEWGIDRGPIPNVTRVVEKRGMIVFMEKFEDSELDGLSFCAEGAPPMIYLNADRPGERIRFTLAHELGHIIMHKVQRQEMEHEANQFAGEFLLPEEDIKCELGELDIYKLMNLKNYWKASIQALVYRAKDIDVITKQKYQSLFRMIGARGFKKNEPNPLEPEKPSIPKLLVDTIHKATHLSVSEIANEMGTSDFDVQLNYLGKRMALRVCS